MYFLSSLWDTSAVSLIIYDCEKTLAKRLAVIFGAEIMKLSNLPSRKSTDLSQYGMIYICSDCLIEDKFPKNLSNFLFTNREQLKDACFIQSMRYYWNQSWDSDEVVSARMSNWTSMLKNRTGAESVYIVNSKADVEFNERLSRCSGLKLGELPEPDQLKRTCLICSWHAGCNEYLSAFDIPYTVPWFTAMAIFIIPFAVGGCTGSGFVVSLLYIPLGVISFLIGIAGADYLKWTNPPQLIVRRIYKPSGEYRDVPNMRRTGTLLIFIAVVVYALIFVIIALFAAGILKTPFI